MINLRSLKLNFILNSTRTVLTVLLGLIVFPYVNNVLGVQSIGKFEYSNNIITYFILFSNLGIPMYGIREIARVRDSEKERTKVVLELLIILCVTSIISYLILFILIQFNPGLLEYKDLILIISPSILMSCIGLEWFFQGMENQLYITIRFIIVKLLSIFLIYTLIVDKDSINIYAAIMTFSLVGANLFNFIYIQKFLNFSTIKLKELNIKKHLRGILTIFLATISVSIYLQLDITLLGYYGEDKNVGYYTISNRLVRLAIVFITTIGAVMVPRLSKLYNDGDTYEYYNYLEKAFKYILISSIPISIIIFNFSDSIIDIMAGKEFEDSKLLLKILSPLVIIIGIAYFLAFMILYPQSKENKYTYVVIFTAILSFALNIIFTDIYLHISTACINLFVEALAVIIMCFIVKKDLIKMNAFRFKNFNYIISGIVMFIVLYSFKRILSEEWYSLLFITILGLIFYIISLLILKDEIISELKLKILEYARNSILFTTVSSNKK